ncbi:hypothetical protein ZIOFF_017714 [Zingiber officinale]|uniref:Uncharacterized protein n=1 Tax=Zingiber officinale TaxID=94328 RepID=A0A8J5H7A8_ZINOF|nr:hypothetical protein ZIOFF_017714 [Zingiber officinale]
MGLKFAAGEQLPLLPLTEATEEAVEDCPATPKPAQSSPELLTCPPPPRKPRPAKRKAYGDGVSRCFFAVPSDLSAVFLPAKNARLLSSLGWCSSLGFAAEADTDASGSTSTEDQASYAFASFAAPFPNGQPTG